jgi:hypothetical protein
MATEELSALRENIARKGTNSYYYAHGHKVDGPQWDGSLEPRLLSRTASTDTTPTSSVPTTPITDYAWGDETSKVVIYIEHEGVHTIPDDQIICSIDNNIFDFKFTLNSKTYQLYIDNLHDEIESVSYKKKENKFTVSLKKKSPVSWYQLKKK